jgi:alpha-beta hydrolase superfamily lysophospholipase
MSARSNAHRSTHPSPSVPETHSAPREPGHPVLRVVAEDGVTLAARHFPVAKDSAPAKAPTPVVLLLPAMMVTAATLDRPGGRGLATVLAALGFEVYAADFRGHGRSQHLKDWSYDDLVLRDVPALVKAVAARHPGAQVAVLGHSLGGHVAAASLGTQPALPVDALVLVGANMWLRRFEPSLWWWLLKRAVFFLFGLFATVYGRFPTRRLGLGTQDEAKSYVHALVGFGRTGRWGSSDGHHDYLAHIADIGLPVLSVNARGDKLLARAASARLFLAAFRNADAEYWEVGHEFLGVAKDPGHMDLVTGKGADRVWREIAQWLHKSLEAQREASATTQDTSVV